MARRRRPIPVLWGLLFGGLGLVLALQGPAKAETCAPPETGLVVTRFVWTLDPAALTARAEVVLVNRGKEAVKNPGALVLAYDGAGKELNQVWARTRAASLKPGASETLVLVMRLPRLPDGVKATTLEGLGGT